MEVETMMRFCKSSLILGAAFARSRFHRANPTTNSAGNIWSESIKINSSDIS
jgi:hypothetical protein